MIEKINLEGFTAIGESKYEGEDQEYAQSHFSYKKKESILALTRRISHETPTYFACAFLFCLFDISYRSGMVPGPGEL